MKPYTDSATHCQAQQAVVIAKRTTRTQDHVKPLLGLPQAMILVESANYQEQYTTETRIPVILVKIGGQEPIGLVFLGKTHKEMCQETPLLKMTTNGIQTLRKLPFQFPTRVQKTATPHSKQTTQPRLKKHTTTV